MRWLSFAMIACLAIGGCTKSDTSAGSSAEPGAPDDPSLEAEEAPGVGGTGQSGGVADPDEAREARQRQAEGRAAQGAVAESPPPAFKMATGEPPPPTPREPAGLYGDAPAGAADGKTLYLRTCAECHGANGTGDRVKTVMPGIGDLTDRSMHKRLGDDDLRELIAKGHSRLPPQRKTLSPQQIDAVVGYVRTFKQ